MLTLDQLREVLTQCAGADEGVNLDGDILDQDFLELGYDSLALIETTAELRRRFGIEIPEDLVNELETPRAMLDYVNGVKAEG
ncbi:acyl carrier protein [Crossiella sp. SN42]|uniref:acyl carrier protein n=1 Tax=Crossiella sp. SN42 TaxID=2944808 RepID=UPI00207C439F|nr:acyl carrier protein [Crossiella sp. SN42]MCO1575098.1 acyl carrier protein [Crossiella sp. SN42]